MRLLITGNAGYVGSVLVRHLKRAMPAIQIIGFDSGYFAHCLTAANCLPETQVDLQYFGDVRAVPDEVLSGVDAVVLLAAVSNDPMGNKFGAVTDVINAGSCIDIARRAIALGARRFVFASSCSMYGFAEGAARQEGDQLNPLTAYAKSKVNAEKGLSTLASDDVTMTSLRFSTACGMSDRLRLDLVLNDFVASALASSEIIVLSDGTPWRPLIDVKDMARAIEWALVRDAHESGPYLAVNVGADEWNYQVKDLAEAVASAMPGTKISINDSAPPDKRSYRVDFSLYRKLAPDHQPIGTLAQSIDELKLGMLKMGFSDSEFRSSKFMRLKALENHIEEARLGEDLRWIVPRQ